MAGRTDEELMLAAGRGDQQAFSELVGRYRLRGERFCHRMTGDWGAAEDLCQEGFVRLYLMRERYQPRARLATLFYGILRNLCVDELRRRGRRSSVEPDASADPETIVLRDLAAAAVRQAIASLTLDYRTALILRELEELEYAQIASVMGWSLAKTKVTIHRARKQLAATLSREADLYALDD